MTLKRLFGCAHGGVLVELALAVPVLGLLLTGGFEVSRYGVLHMKLEAVAGTITDAVARASEMRAAELDAILASADDIASPFDFAGRGAVIVTSVSWDGPGRARVNWQRKAGGVSAGSGLGTAGGAATLPPGFTLAQDESAIVTEAVYDYRPLLAAPLLPAAVLRQTAVFRPRLGSLDTLAP
ncbi:MAG TPA: TadE/TadG family type IV pilus assembly protein [Azospirillum sp.]